MWPFIKPDYWHLQIGWTAAQPPRNYVHVYVSAPHALYPVPAFSAPTHSSLPIPWWNVNVVAGHEVGARRSRGLVHTRFRSQCSVRVRYSMTANKCKRIHFCVKRRTVSSGWGLRQHFAHWQLWYTFFIVRNKEYFCVTQYKHWTLTFLKANRSREAIKLKSISHASLSVTFQFVPPWLCLNTAPKHWCVWSSKRACVMCFHSSPTMVELPTHSPRLTHKSLHHCCSWPGTRIVPEQLILRTQTGPPAPSFHLCWPKCVWHANQLDVLTSDLCSISLNDGRHDNYITHDSPLWLYNRASDELQVERWPNIWCMRFTLAHKQCSSSPWEGLIQTLHSSISALKNH